MPWKPMKPCGNPGCPNLVPAGTRYCEKHQKQDNRDYDRYHRDPAHKERYHSSSWARIRKAKLNTDPLCEECRKAGRYTKATLVHHRLPLSEGGSNNFDNLESLCDSCHSRIHAKHGDRWHGSTQQMAPAAEDAGEGAADV